MFVLDSSVALAALLGDAEAQAAEAIVSRIGSESVFAPANFGLEVAGFILREVQGGALSEQDAIALAREAALWPLAVDDETGPMALNRTLALALAHRLGANEAAYIELCLRRGAPLATMDPRLARVATIHAIRLVIRAPG